MKRPTLSIVLPTYNESGTIVMLIEALIARLSGIRYEILVVDDQSPDKTALLTKRAFTRNPCVHVLQRHERGLATAILFGLRHASGANIMVMDTDFNHNPADIPSLLQALTTADIAVGSRYVPGGGMENRPRFYASMLYNIALRLFLSLPTHDNLSGFFVARRQTLSPYITENIFRGYGDYFIRLLFAAHAHGLRIQEIPVYYRERPAGVSKSRLLSMIGMYTKTVLSLKFRYEN